MTHKILAVGVLMYSFQASLHSASAQALGEYGRTLGGATQRHGTMVPHVLRGSNIKGKVKGGSHGVGDLGVQPLQNRLVVATSSAALYLSQDDESPKMEDLPGGAILIPIMQATSGAIGWYMVKTQKGTMGWVKSSDVLELTARK